MIYLGGDMLSIGQQIRREWEKQELQRLGFKVYAPHDDKGINDKANAKQDKLAERIVANDTEGMERSNIMIFDYLPHAQGTICEMGYAQRLKKKVRRILRFMFNALTLDKGQDIFRKNKIVQSSVSINMCMA
ncbi:nucleoside 2-deoxyribosyltransferase [Staphylococcus haemolyticus]